MEPIDWNALKENCAGDEDLVQEVLDLFRKESAGLLADVRAAVAARDAVAVKKTSHRLKGALVSLGAAPSVAAARELERLGAEADLARVDTVFAGLERAMADLMKTIAVPKAA